MADINKQRQININKTRVNRFATGKATEKVTFLKSGVPFGYSYTAGQQGIVSKDDLPSLSKAGIVTTGKVNFENAASKTATEKR